VAMYAADNDPQSALTCQITAFPANAALYNAVDMSLLSSGSPNNVVKPNTTLSTYSWPVVFVPNTYMNTDYLESAPVTYSISFVNVAGQVSYTQPTVVIQRIVAVNNPPTILPFETYSYIQVPTSSSYVVGFSGIGDPDLTTGDTSSFTVTVTTTLVSGTSACSNSQCTSTISSPNTHCAYLAMNNNYGVTVTRQNSCGFTFSTTMANVQKMLTYSTGIKWSSPTASSWTAVMNLNVNINDNGAHGLGGPLNTTIVVPIHITTSPAFTGPVSAFIGVTAILSLTSYASFRGMKSKKFIPEDSDPWEHDELFDDTLGENPLFSNSQPIYDNKA